METVRVLFREYATELGIDLCFQGFEEELAALPGKYAAPDGRLLLGFDEETPVLVGAIRKLEDGSAELKRLYIRPTHRGQGLGKELTVRLIKEARSAGYPEVRLDTLRRLEPAVKLYESLGFEQTSPYNYNPEDDIVYYRLEL